MTHAARTYAAMQDIAANEPDSMDWEVWGQDFGQPEAQSRKYSTRKYMPINMQLYECQDCGHINAAGPDNIQRIFCVWCDSPMLSPVDDTLPWEDKNEKYDLDNEAIPKTHQQPPERGTNTEAVRQVVPDELSEVPPPANSEPERGSTAERR